jgi:L-alanine-DL-glutamate epimerase-like enolase superfamily enzyme
MNNPVISGVKLVSVTQVGYPIRGGFTISRGAKRVAEVVEVTLAATRPDGTRATGRGECVPYARYDENPAQVIADIHTVFTATNLNRLSLQDLMPPGAARNAIDCAFWDLESKFFQVPAWQRAGLLAEPKPVATAFTLSLDTPAAMARAAREVAAMPLLKVKLGGGADDIFRVAAVRKAAPDATLIVDANEGWTMSQLFEIAPELAALGVALIEQPLPAGQDGGLADFDSPVPIGADESCHGPDSLPSLTGRYQCVNIKLDKTGGLTGALEMKAAAQAAGFQVMIGCMVATSLSMAPAFLLTQGADFVDLDGPLLLEADRPDGIAYDGAWMSPPTAALWG